jgi:hypothetical protein
MHAAQVWLSRQGGALILICLAVVLFAFVGNLHHSSTIQECELLPVAAAVIKWFFANPLSTSDKNLIVYHKRFFVRRRAIWLSENITDFHTEANEIELTQRITSELAEIEAYLLPRIRTYEEPGTLFETGSPDDFHLDLADAAAAKSDLPPEGVSKSAREFAKARRERAYAIVWRAAGIHGADLFPQNGTIDVTLELRHKKALDEVLDRRLRSVERMAYFVNGGFEWLEKRTWGTGVEGPTGPWTDGLRTRVVEYPELPKPPFAHLENTVMSNDWNFAENPLTLNRAWRVPPGISESWAETSDPYEAQYVSGAHPNATAVRGLLSPSSDFYQRSWFNCDHCASSVHLEAFMFGKHRRGDDSVFNEVMNRSPPYVFLSSISDAADLDRLMADGADDQHFDNLLIDKDDLQVGDHVVVWNNYVYIAISNGFWRNEHSFVTDITSTEAGSTDVDAQTTRFSGHGIPPSTLFGMTYGLADRFGKIFLRMQFATAGATGSKLSFNGITDLLIKWNPYGEFTGPMLPWWIHISQRIWHGAWGIPDETTAALAMPGAFRRQDAGLVSQSLWPIADVPEDSFLFPLHQPVWPGLKTGQDPWREYFESRMLGTRRPETVQLILVTQARYAAGLFSKENPSQIPVVRPRIFVAAAG